jgi:O-antigen ligase
LELTKYRTLRIILILFGIFPLLPFQIKGFPVAVALLAGIYWYRKGHGKPEFDRGFLVLISILTISLLSILYSGSFSVPWKKLETSISLLLLPLSFLLIKEKAGFVDLDRRNFYISFIASTSVLSLISIVSYINRGLFSETELRVNSFRQAITELPMIGDHPIYVSIYLGVSLLLIIMYFSQVPRTVKVLFLFIGLINLFHMLLLSSKGIVIAFFITTSYYIFKAIQKNSLRISLIVFLLFLFVIALIQFPNLERRFREIFRKTTYTELRLQNSSSIRLAVYECGIEMALKRPLLGFGWGKGNEALKECYKNKSEELYRIEPNAHNQYLGFLLDGGIPAFLTLLFFIYYFFREGLRRNDIVAMSTILFYAIILGTENILVRQSGLILFIFIFTFHHYSTVQKSN